MAHLATETRNRFEAAIKEARAVAERGARQALESLAVQRRDAHTSMTSGEQALRRRLRAHGRQLGDVLQRDGIQSIDRLVRETAYEHWHRMLFARFLAENHLLIEPASGVAITVEECQDIARDRNDDPWALAASFAQAMLPQIFRSGDPTLAVTLPPETRQALQRLVTELRPEVFTADDSLGWTYQFWQSAEKDAVNARVRSGEKITGATLPAVTQLFTEPYMVQFLLHNTIGAWHAAKVLSQKDYLQSQSEDQLRAAVRLATAGGYDFGYLRFVRDASHGEATLSIHESWRPAAGTFHDWPRTAKEMKVLDPCCGSGHFLSAAFELLVRLRMHEEGMSADEAARAVVANNLYGLELDARCTQIAAFNLALAAWKLVGQPIQLPPMRIACSGLGPQASKEEWLALAEDAAVAGGMPAKRDLFGSDDSLLSAGVRGGLEALYDLFEKAPELGSLIDPRAGSQLDVLRTDFDLLGPLLDAILAREAADDERIERAVAAKGMAEAARILVGPLGGYTLIITNVPYLGRGAHSDWFKDWADAHYREGRNDLATIFLLRMLRWVGSSAPAGSVAAVTPQNWLFLTSYRKLRERLLRERTWNIVGRLGPGAFETIGGHVVSVSLITLSGERAGKGWIVAGIDVGTAKSPRDKAALLRGQVLSNAPDVDHADPAYPKRNTGNVDSDDREEPADGAIQLVQQAEQLNNPDASISLRAGNAGRLLSDVALAYQGISTGDNPAAVLSFWEICDNGTHWQSLQTAPSDAVPFSGRHLVIRSAALDPKAGSTVRGREAWGRAGVAVSQTGRLTPTRYTGEYFSNIIPVVIPHRPENLAALWCFCESGELERALRSINPKLSVDNGYFGKVVFDLSRWKTIAGERYPQGLPEPYSDGPMQWLFHGHPAGAEKGTQLHVAVARLLGYRWPAELSAEMRLSDDALAWLEKSRELDSAGHADDDGIVCLMPVRGEGSAADRLRALLAAAFDGSWSTAKERELIEVTSAADHGSGRRSISLEEWLRDAVFEEHCKIFQHRPFLWHIHDGLRDGFSALVNYHRLTGPDGAGRRTLELLTYSYLGEWVDRQRAAQKSGREGADARLAAALRLQEQLRRILEGEPPYDVFVRWKPLHEQPIGWDPDINDGVRVNIRPFLMAQDVGRKGAGILRRQPNIKWTKDRGKEAEALRSPRAFPWFWGCNPEVNPRHSIDFGAGTPIAIQPGASFDGIRWNDLHYTRAAKEIAREALVQAGS